MALDVKDVISALDPARRRKIEDQAAALIAEEMTLRELRKARQSVSRGSSASARTECPGWGSAATCGARRCAGRSRQWAETSR